MAHVDTVAKGADGYLKMVEGALNLQPLPVHPSAVPRIRLSDAILVHDQKRGVKYAVGERLEGEGGPEIITSRVNLQLRRRAVVRVPADHARVVHRAAVSHLERRDLAKRVQWRKFVARRERADDNRAQLGPLHQARLVQRDVRLTHVRA